MKKLGFYGVIFLLVASFAVAINSNSLREKVLGTSTGLADSPWPTFHGNNQRTGLSPYDTSHVDGTLKWKFNVGTGMEGSPSVGSDGTIYVGAHDGYLYAVKEGELKWKIKIGTPKIKSYGGHTTYTSILSTPTIGNGETIYITSMDQYLFAISSEGKEKWRFPINLTSDHWGSAAIAKDGTIYINASPPDGGLYALNPDGTKKWHYQTKLRMFNSPAIGPDGTIYIAVPTDFGVTKVIAINPDGTLNWDIITPKELESTPAIADDGTVYVGSFSQNETSAGLYAITKEGVKWDYTVGGKEVMSTPAIAKDGTIYFGSFANVKKFYAINSDGTEKWHFDVGGSIESSPAIGADGTIYFGVSNPGRNEPDFYALNPDGTEKWSYVTELSASIPASPAIGADGTVYISSWDGNLYAFGGSGKEVVPTKSLSFPVVLVVVATVFVAGISLIFILRKRR